MIGYITQDDLLIEELTVYENLFYYAKLCFANLTDFEIQRRVEKKLNSLGLFEVKDIVVGSVLIKRISGGQRKRLNIALEFYFYGLYKKNILALPDFWMDILRLREFDFLRT